jgi:hypothetical protein
MKKFLVVLCTVAMVAGLATSAFADGSIVGPAAPANQNPPGLSQPTGESETTTPPAVGGGQPSGGVGTTGGEVAGNTDNNVGGGTTGDSTNGGDSTNVGGSSTGGGATTTDAGPKAEDFAEGSVARALVEMLTGTEVMETGDVLAALGIEGTVKTADDVDVDTTKLSIISLALTVKSAGVSVEKKDGKVIVTMNGSDLTKGLDENNLFVLFAPNDPNEKASFSSVKKAGDNVWTFEIPSEDGCFCLCRVK